MFLLQAAAAAGTHPLDGTAAEWIWVVLLLPLAGAFLNGILGMLTEWHPGPFDPDPIHTGEHAVPISPTLVERAEHAAPRLMSVVEGHDVRTHTGSHPVVGPGEHGDHHDRGHEAGSHARRRGTPSSAS
jgi:hypothetical protein